MAKKSKLRVSETSKIIADEIRREMIKQEEEKLNPTVQIVREAMKIVSKDVKKPKCVRDGLVKPVKKNKKK